MRWAGAMSAAIVTILALPAAAAAQGTPPPNPGDVVNCGDFATWDEANDWFWTYFPHYGDVARLDGDGDLVPCAGLGGAPTEPRPPAPDRCRDDADLVRADEVEPVSAGSGAGYVMLEADGTLHGFGSVVVGDPLGVDAVDVAGTANGGQLVLACDGRVLAVGPATHHGDLDPAALETAEHPVAVLAAPGQDGYWVVSDRGRVTAFGEAQAHGDLWDVTSGALPLAEQLNGPIVAAAPTPTGDGYYLVGADGGVFTFGDAAFHGSTGSLVLNEPVVAIAPDPDGVGYWLIASDGGVFAYEAEFRGSVPAVLPPEATLNAPVVGGIAFGDGYVMVASDGGAFTFSDQPFLGSLGSSDTPEPIVAIAAAVVDDELLAELTVAVAHSTDDYDRDDWRHWVDDDGDCQDTRVEVLIEESTIEPTLTADGCRVTAGRWLDPFTGTVVTDPSRLDIDHLVPLANAHVSGAWEWTDERRESFANDLVHPDALIAVTASANRSKGARGPEAWLPPSASFWCTYGTSWAEVKIRWGLRVTAAEHDALRGLRSTC